MNTHPKSTVKPRKGVRLLLILILACTMVVICCTAIPTAKVPSGTAAATPTRTIAVSPAGTDPESAVTAANNQFGLELYGKLAKDQKNRDSNLFFSPFSISSALAITYEGAKGSTASQIQSVFHFPKDNRTRQNGYETFIDGLNTKDPAYELKTANALWVEKTYSLLPAFTKVATEAYSARATGMDFVKHPDESRQTINLWVENQTNSRIKDLLPSGSVTPDSRLVITNAVYFHGKWVRPFDKATTADAPFMKPDGKNVTVRMMEQTGNEAKFRYAENSRFQALSMPYNHTGQKQLSMLIILPKGNTLKQVESGLDAKTIGGIQKSLENRRVDVYIPKFKLETGYGLVPVLTAMSMKAAFKPGSADFSGMDGSRNLFISTIVHKAYVDVDEEGTEAAAATGVVMALGMAIDTPPVPEFRADHPFIFLIQDDQTGAILFMGRVVNPAA